MAHLDFGWLVATTPLPEHYDQALALLSEFAHNNFPVDQYRENVIHALIFEARGQREKARQYAHMALQAAAARHSGFRYHAKVGLVKSPEEKTYKRLQLLANLLGSQRNGV